MTKIDTHEKLREIYGMPMELAVSKALPKLDPHCRHFIELAPFAVISSADAKGNGDVSPRGDGPGFIKVLDDNTLLMPDRPGNNRVDTLSNIVENPKVGMLFFVPGFNDTLRVNGTAEIHNDAELLAHFADTPKPPITVIRIRVEEAFLHCAKSLMRSKLWSIESQVDRKVMPTLGKIIKDQTAGNFDVGTQEDADKYFAQSIAERG